ncbi:DEAD/DEAH box helicase family protein [Novosphingobium sp. FGD1]|uniref:DEAD/DEAH box helicase family protein n=1 Tax=Novosphingobium silvae TaxID=2692619 RepID=A0A7X4GMG5_9SPHN|nr:DEAD/DEAH box helicase family protein [Novosphingobium silvae]
MTFLTPSLMSGADWWRFERAVARAISHCGWSDVQLVGGTGDQGADLLATRSDPTGEVRPWIIQVKAVTGGGYVGVEAIKEAVNAMSFYGAKSAAVATNGDFTQSALRRRDELAKNGFDIKLWNGTFLSTLLAKWPELHWQRRELRPYQQRIVQALSKSYHNGDARGQFIMATGLGKTVVAAEFTRAMFDQGAKNALVLCHSQDLALQLEQAFWPHLKSSETTSVFFDGKPPSQKDGVTFGLYQTLLGYLPSIEPSFFDIVIVDEAHHALAQGFQSCVNQLKPKYLLGMTATPWRGDGDSIDRLFGPPLETVSLVEGMALGFLTEVDYRMFCDNIDWEKIPQLSKQNLTIRDLNRRLFLPQRDEAALAEIISAAGEVGKPRIIVFSPSISHAEKFADILSASGIPAKNISGVKRLDRQAALMEFSSGRIQALTAVDLLNEGIDVPDVNIIAFMRATHSRRIFVQQLGRGLRLAPDKPKTIVLDFVSDLRRISEVVSMNEEAKRSDPAPEAIYIKDGFVTFSDQKAETLAKEWIADVADLDANDSSKLVFPGI